MLNQQSILAQLQAVIEARKQQNPETSYVSSLQHKGLNKILEKVGEEAVEVILAAKDGKPAEVVSETADLWFHCLVMLSQLDISVQAVMEELERRSGVSGHTEKAGRSPA